MRIQFLGGGLANQIRHYVFVRYAERRWPGEKWFFDDSYFFSGHVYHNGYELESVFGIKPNLLSQYFDKTTWENILRWKAKGVGFPQILLNTGIPVVLVRDPMRSAVFDGIAIKHYGFSPEIITLPYSNVYYDEVWAENEWFMAYQEENRAELVFPPLPDDRNREYADMICESMSVGIHVRRQGFVDEGTALTCRHYWEGCKEVVEKYPNAHFFIFSDELEWCKGHAEELGFCLAPHTTYVAGNSQPNNYIDMQLLSMCRGIIRNARSSFSQVAGWLDRDLMFEIKLWDDSLGDSR